MSRLFSQTVTLYGEEIDSKDNRIGVDGLTHIITDRRANRAKPTSGGFR